MPSRFATINRNIRLDFNHRVYFTRDSFSATNETLADILQPKRKGQRTKTIVYLDEGILDGMPNLPEQIESYFRSREDRLDLVCAPKFAPEESQPKTISSTSNKYGVISTIMQCAGTPM